MMGLALEVDRHKVAPVASGKQGTPQGSGITWIGSL